MRPWTSAATLAVATFLVLPSPHALGQAAPTLPSGFTTTTIGSDWKLPTSLFYIDAHRLLVTEKGGKIWIVEDDEKKNVVVDLTDEALNNGDRGLLAAAVDAQFATNGRLYLLVVVDPHTNGVDTSQESYGRLVRYGTITDAQGQLVVDPASRVDLLGSAWPLGIPSLHLSHSVGTIRFLSDGSLVMTCGDGAHYDLTDSGGHDPGGFGPGKLTADQDVGSFRSQYLDTLAGKVLRLDPETGLGLPDNPFFDGNAASPRSRTYALGLRNPFRFILKPGSGPKETLFISDVGWNTWEEIDVAKGGENFGWPCFEGAGAQPQYQASDPLHFCASPAGLLTPPLLTWNHSAPGSLGFTGNSATGLAFYAATTYPPVYHGALFFCDYGHNWIRALKLDANLQVAGIVPFGTNVQGPVDLTTDPTTGDLVTISYSQAGTSTIRRISYTGSNAPPIALATATPAWGPAPLAVQLSAAGSFDPEGSLLTYAWDLGDGTTSQSANLTKVYDAPGTFAVKLTVADAFGFTGHASLVVTPGNTPPHVASIDSPAAGTFYDVGDTIQLSARADDLEDDAASIPLQALWTIDLMHGDHVHPNWVVVSGMNGSFTTEPHGEDAYYRITFTVTDSAGISASSSVNAYDANALPIPHLESLSDYAPRVGETVIATAHVEFPGDNPAKPKPTLLFDWGDGSPTEIVPNLVDGQEVTATHVYLAPGDPVFRLGARLGEIPGGDQTVQAIHVFPKGPAVAVFAPLIQSAWISSSEQQAIASSIVSALTAMNVKAQLFTFDQQPELKQWMETYLVDGVRDAVVLLDDVPAALYAGENDGSLAERWLELGNGIVWSGQQPFFEHIFNDGSTSSANGGVLAADEVLDAAQFLIAQGAGTMTPTASAADLPSLATFVSQRALRYDQLGAEWHVDRLYATDDDKDSDAIAIRHASGGFYAQFLCANTPGLPRAAVLKEFLKSYLLTPRHAAPFAPMK